ncbi:sensor domain-containing diguanylate cyclase [Paenibacillus turpanensis]|uniref:sensor domain-containing diguanylate cyclase n=1 Tax=Paenibacillus turpanensis TaxID=2689078 RepID=UPI0014096D4F|nr:diguanylate cyclase [Paenibacillus turpanensis]
MKLRMKAFLVVSITMILFLLLLFGTAGPILLRESKLLDDNNTLKDAELIKNNMESDLQGLSRTNRDWAVWDDTYYFLLGAKPDYVEVNLLSETFENNQVSFIIYLNAKNELVYQQGYDLHQHKELHLERAFYETFLPIAQSYVELNEALLVQTSNGLSMASLHSVYTSIGEGPSAGTIIMGRFIDSKYLSTTAKELSLTLHFQEKDSNSTTDAWAVAAEPVSETEIKGSLTLKDYMNQYTYEMSFIGQRHFYLEKKESIKQLGFLLVLIGLFFILFILLLLDRFILSRVYRMSLQLNRIQNEKNVSERIRTSTKYRDELTTLENSINMMLQSLEEKHNEVTKLAYYDHLTLLPNRYLLEEEFRKRIEAHSSLALLFFDLDGFKRINDTLGHEAGDVLLQTVANRLAPVLAKVDGLAARYGGDEFVILVRYHQHADIIALANAIIAKFGEMYTIPSQPVRISASIGISLYPQDGNTLDELLKNADIAMYEAKKGGKNQWAFYTIPIQ